MILRIILIGLLIYVVTRFILLTMRYLKSQSFEMRDQVPPSDSEVNEMVRDPVCGVYITPREAISVVERGRRIHFCSEQCRQKYIDGQA